MGQQKSACELRYYRVYSENPDEMFCGALYGTCPRYRKFSKAPGPFVIGVCPYYQNGRDKLAKIIAEIMPTPNMEGIFNEKSL